MKRHAYGALALAAVLAGFIGFCTPTKGADLGTAFDDTAICEVPVLTRADFTAHGMDEGLAYGLYLGLREAACGDGLAAVFPDFPGLTDRQVLERVFNGETVPPATVPLPWAVWLLLSAITALVLWAALRGGNRA